MFAPIQLARASEEVAQQIKQAIFDGHLLPGDRLPSERDLAEQFGLSRLTIREALRMLEVSGLIEVRVGANGGAYVRTPSVEPVNRAFTTMLKLQQASLFEFAEARKVVEVAIAGLAAERATPEDLEVMREILEVAEQALAAGDFCFMPHSVKFHVALARAARNKVLLFTMESLRSLHYAALEQLPAEKTAQRAITDHRRIYEAVKNRDVDQARGIMEEHINYFWESVSSLKK